MPDLGEYTGYVLWSYAVSFVLIGGILVLSFWQRGRVKRALDEVEARQGKSDG
jgi:heme exporter protein CcmD